MRHEKSVEQEDHWANRARTVTEGPDGPGGIRGIRADDLY